jgi:hypothetical protein
MFSSSTSSSAKFFKKSSKPFVFYEDVYGVRNSDEQLEGHGDVCEDEIDSDLGDQDHVSNMDFTEATDEDQKGSGFVNSSHTISNDEAEAIMDDLIHTVEGAEGPNTMVNITSAVEGIEEESGVEEESDVIDLTSAVEEVKGESCMIDRTDEVEEDSDSAILTNLGQTFDGARDMIDKDKGENDFSTLLYLLLC